MIKYVLASLFIVPASVYAKSFPKEKFVPGEVIVRYKASALKSLNTSRFEKKLLSSDQGTFLLKVEEEKTLEAVEELKKDPTVEHAQPNYIYRLLAKPNDTYLSQLWSAENTGQEVGEDLTLFGPGIADPTANPGVKDNHMSLLPTWELVKDCSGTVVAVIDTGVTSTHEDLAANMWEGTDTNGPIYGYNSVDDSTDTTDQNGHGTHVAGTIGAVGNNGRGVTGVCWNVKIMPIKVFAPSGGATSQSVADGIDWAVDKGAHILNMSLGGEEKDQVLDDAIKAASDAGVIVVMAAGNEANNNDSKPMYPCNFRHELTICVGALNQAYGLADFSNYGKTSVDVAAPGVNILSAWPYKLVNSQNITLDGWSTTANNSTIWGAGYNSGIDFISAPAGWDGRKRYANNTNATAYKTFSTGGATQNRATVAVTYNLLFGDVFNFYVAPGTVNPVTATNPFYVWKGVTGNWSYQYYFDITDSCAVSVCTMGFQLKTDSTGMHTGVLFYNIFVQGYHPRNNGYNVISGTSMASPQVAGLAALVRTYNSYNNSYTPLDVVNAVKNSGGSLKVLADKTVTGRAVNALNAVHYIQPPKGLAAVYVPPTPPEDTDPGTPEP